MFSTTIGAGDVYVHSHGRRRRLGRPAERDPGCVADDVADGKVTAQARERYGVVVSEDGAVDAAGTATLRGEGRA